MGSIPSLGRSPRASERLSPSATTNWAHAPERLSCSFQAWVLQLMKKRVPRARARQQEKPLQWETCAAPTCYTELLCKSTKTRPSQNESLRRLKCIGPVSKKEIRKDGTGQRNPERCEGPPGVGLNTAFWTCTWWKFTRTAESARRKSTQGKARLDFQGA